MSAYDGHGVCSVGSVLWDAEAVMFQGKGVMIGSEVRPIATFR